MKGRRCAEFASGEFERFLQGSMSKTRNAFLVCVSRLNSPEDKAALHQDFRSAMDILLTEATVKTSHWQQLPWALCGIAGADGQLARDAARRCLALFDRSLDVATDEMRQFVLCQHHPLSKRFLLGCADDGQRNGATCLGMVSIPQGSKVVR